MKTSIEKLRTETARQLRLNSLQAAVICLALILLSLRISSGDFLPLLADERASSFTAGLIMGLLAVAAVVSVRRIIDLRRALANDTALRHYHAIENDELRAHMEREVARTFVLILPMLDTIAIVVAAFAGFEATVAAAATAVFLSLALLAVKLSAKLRYRALADVE